MEEDATNLYEDAIGAVRLRQYFLGGLESRGAAMDDSKLTGTIVPISEIFLILKTSLVGLIHCLIISRNWIAIHWKTCFFTSAMWLGI